MIYQNDALCIQSKDTFKATLISKVLITRRLWLGGHSSIIIVTVNFYHCDNMMIPSNGCFHEYHVRTCGGDGSCTGSCMMVTVHNENKSTRCGLMLWVRLGFGVAIARSNATCNLKILYSQDQYMENKSGCQFALRTHITHLVTTGFSS
jgi:hypothetical protein